MTSVVSAITKTVPILQFNRGLAGQIFSDVKSHGSKVVMKNNAAEVVLMPPAEYVEVMDALNDYLLLTIAIERMANADSSSLITEEEMDKRLGITREELDSIGEVEFE
ncbi:MAG: type II toxin-antitoxin system Phd/YefM family antitoxin [bacterium]|nr:type II toxin-antitoxin system Phd/YefM family antitoxin [bacterium]